jgi:hypothetical protein
MLAGVPGVNAIVRISPVRGVYGLPVVANYLAVALPARIFHRAGFIYETFAEGNERFADRPTGVPVATRELLRRQIGCA